MSLPDVTCRKCYMVQTYRWQEKCIHCGKEFNGFDIQDQLKNKKFKTEDRIDLMRKLNERLQDD